MREDVTLDGYRKHVVSAAAPGPMSREERCMVTIVVMDPFVNDP